MNRFILIALMMIMVTVAAARAEEEHSHLDFSPTLEGGQVASNGWDDAAASDNFHAGERVFGLEFGETPGDPFFAGDPGFNVRPGSGFAPGSRMGFALLDALLYWDGTGGVTFTTPAAGTSIELSFGSSSRSLSDAAFDAAHAFVGPTVGGAGDVHFHLNTLIAGPGAGDPVDGIYLIQMALLNNAGGVTASEAVYVLFNLGLDEELHEAAMAFVEAAFVPEPGAAALMLAGLGGLGAFARRRRR